MELKLCKGPLCLEQNPEGVEKSVEEFPWKIKKMGKRGTYCKPCQRHYGRQDYKKNTQYYKDKAKRNNKPIVDANRRRILEYLLEHSCVDCGEARPVVLEFDHVRGKKRQSISVMIQHAFCWATIEEEIEKCEVRCANCHRIRTAKDQWDWWGFDLLEEIMGR